MRRGLTDRAVLAAFLVGASRLEIATRFGLTVDEVEARMRRRMRRVGA